MTDTVNADGLAALRAPFPPNQISKLPKNVAKEGNAASCRVCGGWHRRAGLHLDYVGHAALTDRLLDVDPLWTWEPVGVDEHGIPVLDKNGGLWIRLTVCGVTRLGYGHADGKTGGDAVKEAIGDALRNAGMRFGAALDLWHKGDLHVDADEQADDPLQAPKKAQRSDPPADPSTVDDPWAATAEPERVTDQTWIEGFRQRITAASKPSELRGLQEEANVQWADRKLSREDAQALKAEVAQRDAELKGVMV